MAPAGEFALVAQSRFEFVKVHRSIQPAVDVILARPLQFDWGTVGAAGLGDRHRFDDVIRTWIGTPPETAARIERMDAYLLGRQSCGMCGVGLINRLEL